MDKLSGLSVTLGVFESMDEEHYQEIDHMGVVTSQQKAEHPEPVAPAYTPGEWKCGADEPFVYALNEAGSNRFFAGIQPGWLTGRLNKPKDARTSQEELMANARLIAAAPDLLSALQPFAHFACDVPHKNEPPCFNCVARSAIAKAKGATDAKA